MYTIATLLVPVLIPPVVYLVVGTTEGMGLTGALAALAEQLVSGRPNLAGCALIGLFPVLLLHIVLWLYGRLGGDATARIAMGWWGLAAIAVVLAWVNLEFWPLYLPARTSPGFPHGLEFVIGPVVFAPAGAAFAIFLGWLLNRPTHAG